MVEIVVARVASSRDNHAAQPREIGIHLGLGLIFFLKAERGAKREVDHVQAVGKVVVGIGVGAPLKCIEDEVRCSKRVVAENFQREQFGLRRHAGPEEELGVVQLRIVVALIRMPLFRHANPGDDARHVGAMAVAGTIQWVAVR